MSLKKRLTDRVDTRQCVVVDKDVPGTHTEKLMFTEHEARRIGRNKRKQKRQAARRRT